MVHNDRNTYDKLIKEYAPIVREAARIVSPPALSRDQQIRLESLLTDGEHIFSGGISRLQDIISFISERLSDRNLSDSDRQTYKDFLENIDQAIKNNEGLRNKVIGQAVTDLNKLLATLSPTISRGILSTNPQNETKKEKEGVSTIPETPKPVDTKRMQDLKTGVEKNLKSTLTGPDLIANLESISKFQDPVQRHFGMQYIWGQLMNAGYTINIINNKIELLPIKNTTDATRTTELERALSTSLERNFISQADIEQSIIIGSGSKFKAYLDSTARGASISTDSYTRFLLETYNISGQNPKEILQKIDKNPTITDGEKAYLRSSLGGAMKDVDMQKVSDIYKQSVQEGVNLFSLPGYQAIAPLVGNTTPKTSAQAEAVATALASNPHSPVTADGKPISWIVGGILAIFGLGYSKAEGFSFWKGLKRAFIGVVAIVAGCAVGKEWKKELGFDLCDEVRKSAKEAMGQSKEAIVDAVKRANGNRPTNQAPNQISSQTSNQAPNTPASSNNTQQNVLNNLTPSQKASRKRVEEDSRISDIIKNQKAKTKNAALEEYLDFIEKNCGDKKMEVFLSRQGQANDDISIFANSSAVHPSITLPGNFDPLVWKDIMRIYVSGLSIPTLELSGPGYAKHKSALEAFSKKEWTPDDTLREALPKIQR